MPLPTSQFMLAPIQEEPEADSTSTFQINSIPPPLRTNYLRRRAQAARSDRLTFGYKINVNLRPKPQSALPRWHKHQPGRNIVKSMRRMPWATKRFFGGSESSREKEIEAEYQGRHVFGMVKSWIKSLVAVIARKATTNKLLLMNVFLFVVLGFKVWQLWTNGSLTPPLFGQVCGTTEFGYNASHIPSTPFPPPEDIVYRSPDIIDTFANYSYRHDDSCLISSLDLHSSFGPLCQSKADFLRAFSGGGRIGFDRPFMPLDCDMRWFTSEEVCETFSRFEKVIVVGDSMMRHVVGALNVLLRKDLGYGAVTNWNFNDEEFKDCFCNHQMDVKSCSVQGIFSTSSVLENDPTSLSCTQPIDLVIEMMLRFPLDPTEIDRFKNLLSRRRKPAKPYAFIFGHGLWNDLDLQATLNWLDGILAHAIERAPYLDKQWYRLFVTPNAAGSKKPDEWLVTQGDKALQIFEESVRVQTALRGIDHLGTWNMSVQASKYDGVHLDLKGNLIKAMGVVNWLGFLDAGQQ